MHLLYDIKKPPFSFNYQLMIEIIFLSLIQGITEFLPISSSSHLIIFSELSNFQEKDLSIDVSLHIGSFYCSVNFFSQRFKKFLKK